jgi:vacuolar-type H+-ATPase subunit C/Vma6
MMKYLDYRNTYIREHSCNSWQKIIDLSMNKHYINNIRVIRGKITLIYQ